MGVGSARSLTVAAALVGVALVVPGHAGPVSADGQATSGTISTSGPISRARAYPDFAPVPADTVRELAALSVDVTDPGVEQDSVAVSLERAVDVARGDAAQSSVGVSQGVASLAIVTTRGFGVDLEPDPTKPPEIQPTIDHELTWVITFTSVPGRVISGRPSGTAQGSAAEYLGTVVIFVSAQTGEFIYGMAF